MIGGIVFFGELDELDAELEGSGARSSLENGTAYGVDVGIGLSERLGADVRLRYVPTDFSVHDGTQSFGFQNDLLIGGIGVSYLPDAPTESITPVLSVGGGFKRYSFFESGGLDFMWNVGAALVFETPLLRLRFDLMDFMSVFRSPRGSKFQNDVMFTTAVVLSEF